MATEFLFGSRNDFGISGFNTSSVESFLRDAGRFALDFDRVPWPAPSQQEADDSFSSLSSSNYTIKPLDGFIGVAGFSHCGLRASDHFLHDQRMRCGGYDRLSPVDMWKSIATDSGPLWRRVLGCATRFSKTDRLDESLLRAVTRLSGGCYNAAQFKPVAAKAIISHFQARRVLDPCAGWGDRLVAAIAAGVEYVGTDPNANNMMGYDGIIRRYGGAVSVRYGCFEDLPAPDGEFDLAFTSPPYYDTERYAAGTQCESLQSWKRYNTLDLWTRGFLAPMVHKCHKALSAGGILAVNIKDSVRKGGETLRICDRLEDVCLSHGFQSIGVIALAMKSAPGNVPKHRPAAGKSLYEPVFCFRKG